jgi:hypothetical protein
MLLLTLFLSCAIALKCKKIIVRREVHDLTPKEWKTFISTIQLAQNTPDPSGNGLSVWETAGQIHYDAAIIPNNIHGNCQFAFWHRYFLYEMEQRLRKLNPKFKFPYWESSREWNKATESIVWKYIGKEGKPASGNPFGSKNLKMISTSKTSKVNWASPLERKFGPTGFGDLPALEIYDSMYQESLRNGGFKSWQEKLEYNHGHMHENADGMMTTHFSPLDPLFWLHHAHIDFVWVQASAGWRANGMGPEAQFGEGPKCAASQKIHHFGKPFGDLVDTSQLCVRYALRGEKRKKKKKVKKSLVGSKSENPTKDLISDSKPQNLMPESKPQNLMPEALVLSVSEAAKDPQEILNEVGKNSGNHAEQHPEEPSPSQTSEESSPDLATSNEVDIRDEPAASPSSPASDEEPAASETIDTEDNNPDSILPELKSFNDAVQDNDKETIEESQVIKSSNQIKAERRMASGFETPLSKDSDDDDDEDVDEESTELEVSQPEGYGPDKTTAAAISEATAAIPTGVPIPTYQKPMNYTPINSCPPNLSEKLMTMLGYSKEKIEQVNAEYSKRCHNLVTRVASGEVVKKMPSFVEAKRPRVDIAKDKKTGKFSYQYRQPVKVVYNPRNVYPPKRVAEGDQAKILASGSMNHRFSIYLAIILLCM